MYLSANLFQSIDLYCPLQDLESNLIELSQRPALKDHESLILWLMSHGGEGTLMTSDMKDFQVSKLTVIFSNKNCPNLQGKPKLVFVQACRGGKNQNIFL